MADRIKRIKPAYSLGANLTNPKVLGSKVDQIIAVINDLSDGTYPSAINITDTTQSTSATTGSLITNGGVGITKNLTVGGAVSLNKGLVKTLTGVAINTTGAGTLTVVTSGLVAGLITSTSAAAVTITLDSVTNIITAFATAGVAVTTGTQLQFLIDNSQGANTVTLAVDSGATIAVATPALTGGATLTISTANKIGMFSLYITSTTTGILSRMI